MHFPTSTLLLVSSAIFSLAAGQFCQGINSKKCHNQAKRYCQSLQTGTTTAGPTPTTVLFADNPCVTGGTPPNVVEEKRAAVTGLAARGKGGVRVPPCLRGKFSDEEQASSACACLGYTATATVAPPVETAISNVFVVQANSNQKYLYPSNSGNFLLFNAADAYDYRRVDHYTLDSNTCRLVDYNGNFAGIETSSSGGTTYHVVRANNDANTALSCTIDRETGDFTCVDPVSLNVIMDNLDPVGYWFRNTPSVGDETELTAFAVVA